MARNSLLRSSYTDWMLVYRDTGDADGIIESPYFITNFDDDRLWWPAGMTTESDLSPPLTPSEEQPCDTNGTARLFYPEGSELQLLPLFSSDSATAVVQLWGFDTPERGIVTRAGLDLEDVAPRYLRTKDGGTRTNQTLGEAFNVARDDPGQPGTLAFAATNDLMTLKADLTLGDPMPHDDNGESFAVGARHTFDVQGAGAFMVYVPSVSAGELLVFARFRTGV